MSVLHRVCLVLSLLLAPLGTAAQVTQSQFASYEDMRAGLDAMMKGREITSVMQAFGDTTPPEDLAALQQQVRNLYTRDFDNVALIRRRALENGFRQELLAYWYGTSYIYVYVLLHEREDGVLALSFDFNSAFDILHDKF